MADMTRDERVLDYAHVEDVQAPGLRYIFIRLVPRTEGGEDRVADTLIGDEAHVDVDSDGNVIGVTVMLR